MNNNFNFALEPDLVPFEDKTNIFTDAVANKTRQRLPRMSQLHVEDCIKIRIGDFGRHLLSRADPNKTGPEKKFIVKHGPLARAQVFYRLGEEHLQPYVELRSEYKGLWFSQYIELGCSNAGFGLRPFFTCQCGYLCSTLFLHPERPYSFVCRHCLGLRYELNGLNKRSLSGGITYFGVMINKLIKEEESIKRRAYGHNVTKRFRSYAMHYCKWQDFLANNKALFSN